MPIRYELLLRFNEQTGALRGAHARYADGSLMPITPQTLGDWLPQALIDALTANSELTSAAIALIDERDAAIAELTARTTERDTLQAQIDAAAASAAQTVPAHHLRRALTQFGMRAAVEAHIGSLPDDDPMRDDWQYAPYFSRSAVGIEAARVALGLTAGQVDALFAAAAQTTT